MKLEIKRAFSQRRVILERCLQFFLYETGADPDFDGLIDYCESLDRFFDGPAHIPLFINVDDVIVGIALVKLDRAPAGPDGKTPVPGTNILDSFFVSRRWRRKGIGTRAVHMIFDRYAGRWMVTTWPDETRERFWRKVSGTYERGTSREYAAGDHKGYPGQCVWVVEPRAIMHESDVSA